MPFIPLFQSPKSFYRSAVASFFFLQGLVFASWASRIPDIKQALALNEAQLGGVLFAIPVGQMSAMALSGYLVSRFGSHRMLLLAALLYSGTLMALGFISETWQLFAMLVFFGVAANLHNISVNTQAVGSNASTAAASWPPSTACGASPGSSEGSSARCSRRSPSVPACTSVSSSPSAWASWRSCSG